RDNNLPFGRALARVSTSTRTPIVPAIVVGIAAALLLVANVNFPKVVELVLTVAILWANLAYLLVTGPLLLSRLRGWPARGGSGVAGVFSLGRWGLPVNLLAVAWGVFAVVNIGWPRATADVTGWQC